MNGKIKLNSGREIAVSEIRQSLTYAGLLEGLPTTEMNHNKIQSLIFDKQNNKFGKPFLISPTETPISLDGRPYPFGSPAQLPSVTCVADCKSRQTNRNPVLDYSMLTIIWFQDDYAFPIEPDILVQIQNMTWDEYATDFEW